MKPLLGVAALALVLPFTACGGSSATKVSADRTDETPSTAMTTPAGATGGSCIKDHKWTLDTADFAAQMKRLMESALGAAGGKASVESVKILSGTQTMDMTSDTAKWTDDMVVEIAMKMGAGSASMAMVMTQTHKGSSSGAYKIDGATLVPQGTWDGQIKINTQTKIGGKVMNTPMNIDSGSTDFGSVTLGFTCTDGKLVVTVPGKSPLSLTFS